MTFVLYWLMTFVALLFIVSILPGIRTVGGNYAGPAVVAAFLALANIIIKPILIMLSMPLLVLTLGLFTLVVNAVLLMLAASLSNGVFRVGIEIDSFGSALLGALIISIITYLLGLVLM